MKNLGLLFTAMMFMCLVSCSDDDPRENFYGDWTGTLSGCAIPVPVLGQYDVPESNVTMTMSEDTSADGSVAINFLIEGFADENITGTVSGDVVTIVPFQQTLDAGGFPITINFSGSGTRVSDTQIDMELIINAGAGDGSCPLTITKA